MRGSLALVLCLGVAACNRGLAPTSFDGALTNDKAALIRHGDRLADVLGCRGCHGKNLQGTFFTKDEPQYGPL